MNTEVAVNATKEAAAQVVNTAVEKAPEVIEQTANAAYRSGNWKVIAAYTAGAAGIALAARGAKAVYDDAKDWLAKRKAAKAADAEKQQDEKPEDAKKVETKVQDNPKK